MQTRLSPAILACITSSIIPLIGLFLDSEKPVPRRYPFLLHAASTSFNVHIKYRVLYIETIIVYIHVKI
jgi:hypothetical protein